jgi:predicted ATPase
MMLVSGPAGIGKSRLLAEALRRTTAHVLVGRCIENGGVPYLPWVEMIRAHLRSEDPAALRENLGEAASELGRLLPALGTEDVTPPLTADPDLARLRLFESIGSFFESVARRHRLVVVLEDLHWADGASVRALQLLAPRLLAAGAAVLATMRNDDAPDPAPGAVLQALARDGLLRTLALDGLPAPEARQLIRQVGGDAIPTPIIERLAAGSEGNPFFIEELLRHLGDLELIDRRSGQWRSQLVQGELPLDALTAEQQRNYDELTAQLAALRASVTPCPGDGNLDLVVDDQDLDDWRFYSESSGLSSVYDLNLDGLTDADDEAFIQANFGDCRTE